MKIVDTEKAPKAIGPYSQAIKCGDFLFCSGQIPLNSAGEVVSDDPVEQAKQVLQNLKEVLLAGGSDFSRVVKTTVFLTDLSVFPQINEVYAEFFGNHKPARSTVQVSALPKGVKVEIECIASVS